VIDPRPAVTPLAELLADRIAREGPIPFREFMEAALYHPAYGYYCRPRDPFGKSGDFYTAEQLQPVFGILIAARIREMFRELGSPPDFTVVELGAGRGEMAPAFAEWRYLPIEIGADLPQSIRGVVFSNEFFDALPVDAATVIDGTPRELRVGIEGGRFTWVAGDRASPAIEEYWRRYCPQAEVFEVNLAALDWIDRIARSLAAGFHLTIDYGYVTSEHIRFRRGTLMSYRRHAAAGNVLADPGERDITAHVSFSALQERGEALGLRTLRCERLAQTLLHAGEPDQFAAALTAATAREEQARRLQLKTLLFGMGETFRTLMQRKESAAAKWE
jgi:SAM-dependent MidA family methyltransferase